MSESRPTIDLSLIWIAGRRQRRSVDPELFALLDAVARTGKLTTAAREAGMSYRNAWGLVAAWSDQLGQPLVNKEQGRGTALTPLGARVLSLQQRISARLSPHLESAASEIEQELHTILNESRPALCVYASHDLALAELRDFLRVRPGPNLDVRFVGSLDSVIALCKSRCDVAGFHFAEGRMGRAVFHIYEPWLKPRTQRLIHFVRREQGLIVARGNPLRLATLADVARTKARLINRQAGSGTRSALDQMLRQEGIDRNDINGYCSEEFTHLAVAAAVAGDVADVGLGIEAAARKLKMDFVPLFAEEYYLLAKKETIERGDVADLLAVLRGEAFRDLVRTLPGYDASRAGTVVALDAVMEITGGV